MSEEQPEALRLAKLIDYHTPIDFDGHLAQAATELRRLYAENEALRAQIGQTAVVQQEHVGVVGEMPGTSGFTMACFHADNVPVGSKLYTHPAPQQKPLTDEQDRALCEAYCNAASDEYFKARPQLDSSANRRIFYAGHRKAWIEWQAAHNIGEKK